MPSMRSASLCITKHDDDPAIRDENYPEGGCDTLSGREKVPVPADRGNLP